MGDLRAVLRAWGKALATLGRRARRRTSLCIAGLWERWRSATGADISSFAMLTINCDQHPLLSRFHKHFDKKGEPNDRRTPALLREEAYDRWLGASLDEAPSFFTTFGSDDL